MTRPKALSVLIVFAACIAATAIWGWHHLSQRRTLPFPISAKPAIARRIYSTPSGTPPPDNAPRLHDWKVVGDPLPIPPDLASELRTVLSSPSTYSFQDSHCFEPGMAVSFGEGPTRVDVLICLLCNRTVFHSGNAEVGRSLSDEGNKRLSSIYQRLFPAVPTQ